jgi:hypothetical protein
MVARYDVRRRAVDCISPGAEQFLRNPSMSLEVADGEQADRVPQFLTSARFRLFGLDLLK